MTEVGLLERPMCSRNDGMTEVGTSLESPSKEGRGMTTEVAEWRKSASQSV
jgi:hypothetical protein